MRTYKILRRIVAVALAILAVGVGGASAASASAIMPSTVHTERVQAGPYGVTVAFTAWPVRAMQSLEFTFAPDGGIAGKSGTVSEISPEGTADESPLARHPRDRQLWGLDVHSVPTPGTWTYRFTIDGPQGQGTGELPVNVLDQPGPPIGPMWVIGLIPVALGVVFMGVVWIRTGPAREKEKEEEKTLA